MKRGNFFHKHDICLSGTTYALLLTMVGIGLLQLSLATTWGLTAGLIYLLLGFYLLTHHRPYDKATGFVFFALGWLLLLQTMWG